MSNLMNTVAIFVFSELIVSAFIVIGELRIQIVKRKINFLRVIYILIYIYRYIEFDKIIN